MTTQDTPLTSRSTRAGVGAAAGGGTGVARTPRAWAVAGVAAGITGLVSIQSSMGLSADWETTAGDAQAIVAGMDGKLGTQLVFHTATVLTTLLLVVFAAGLARRLAQQGPAGSLLPSVASGGLLLVAVAGLLGSGLDTQFLFAFAEPDKLVPESGAFYTDWVATIPWLWVGAGLSGVAVAVAALRHGAAPRWIGWVSAVLGGLTLITGVSPLQYMAGFTGPLWLLVVALGFALGGRR